MAKESGKISELNTAGRDSGLSFQTANGLGIEEKKIYNHGSLKVPKNAETDRGISLLQFRAVATSKYLIDQSSMDEFIDHFLAKTYSNEFKEQKFKMVDLIAEHIKQIEDWRSIASLKRPLAEEGFLRSLSEKATIDDPNLMMTAQDYVNLLKGVIEFKKELKDQFAKFPEKILGEKWRSIYHDTVNLDRKALLSEFSEWTETKFGKVSYHSPVNGEMVEKLAPIVNDIDLVDHIKAIDPKLSPQHVKEFTDFLFKGGADAKVNFDGVPWSSQDIVKQLQDWKKFTFEKNLLKHDTRAMSFEQFLIVARKIFGEDINTVSFRGQHQLEDTIWMPQLLSATLKDFKAKNKLPEKISQDIRKAEEQLEQRFFLNLDQVIDLYNFKLDNKQRKMFKQFAMEQHVKNPDGHWALEDVKTSFDGWENAKGSPRNSRPHTALKKTGSMFTAQEASSKPPTRSLLKHIKKILAKFFGKLMQYLRGKKMA